MYIKSFKLYEMMNGSGKTKIKEGVSSFLQISYLPQGIGICKLAIEKPHNNVSWSFLKVELDKMRFGY